jgi:hypothetical protein
MRPYRVDDPPQQDVTRGVAERVVGRLSPSTSRTATTNGCPVLFARAVSCSSSTIPVSLRYAPVS